MASTYSTDLKLELMATGENAGTWGTKTNTNLNLLQQAIAGYQAIDISASDVTLVMTDASISNARNMVLKLTGTLPANRIVTIPDGIEKTYIVENGTSGAYTVQFKTVSGTGTTFSTTDKGIKFLYSNGTNVIDVNANFATSSFSELQLKDDSGGEYITLQAPATVPSSYTLSLPAADGSNGAFLQTNGSGVLSFANIYPVGSIYINATNATNPSTLLGFGTWVSFGSGRVMVGLDSGDSSFNTPEETGGSKNAIVVSHTHTFSGSTNTTGAHSHVIDVRDANSNGALIEMAGTNGPVGTSTTRSAGDHSHTFSGTTSSSGSSGTNANLQPYIVVYMWKRTA